MYNVNCLALIISGDLCHCLRCMSLKMAMALNHVLFLAFVIYVFGRKKKKGKAHLNNGLSRVKDTPIFPLFLCKMNPKIIS